MYKREVELQITKEIVIYFINAVVTYVHILILYLYLITQTKLFPYIKFLNVKGKMLKFPIRNVNILKSLKWKKFYKTLKRTNYQRENGRVQLCLN